MLILTYIDINWLLCWYVNFTYVLKNYGLRKYESTLEHVMNYDIMPTMMLYNQYRIYISVPYKPENGVDVRSHESKRHWISTPGQSNEESEAKHNCFTYSTWNVSVIVKSIEITRFLSSILSRLFNFGSTMQWWHHTVISYPRSRRTTKNQKPISARTVSISMSVR
jgi:hypothetical protein